MRKFKGRWIARVDQDFEIDAEDEDDARALIEDEMAPSNVIELLDMEIVELREV